MLFGAQFITKPSKILILLRKTVNSTNFTNSTFPEPYGRGGGVLLGPGNPIPRNSVFPSQLLFSTFFLARVPERLFRPKSPKSGPKGTKSEPK